MRTSSSQVSYFLKQEALPGVLQDLQDFGCRKKLSRLLLRALDATWLEARTRVNNVLHRFTHSINMSWPLEVTRTGLKLFSIKNGTRYWSRVLEPASQCSHCYCNSMQVFTALSQELKTL